MASFNLHLIKPIHVLFLALLVPLWGVVLDKLGLVHLTVGFLSGIFGTLFVQVLAVYYFILKIDNKQTQKRANLRKENEEHSSASTSSSSSSGPYDAKSSANLRQRLSSLNTHEKMGSVEGVKNTVEGTVQLQFVGKKKERAAYNCFINQNHFYYVKKKEGKGPNMVFTPQAVLLEGCEVRLVVDDELKGVKYALEIQHPMRKVLYKIDYFFLIFDSEADMQRWYFALLTVCKPRNGYVDFELNKQLHERFQHFVNTIESANWMNALLSRFWLNMRQSPTLRDRLTEKMATRFAEKLEEKNLQEYIGDIELEQIDLGTHPPTIASVILLPPDSSGDLLMDCDLIYKNGTAKLSLSAQVYIKTWATVPLKLSVTLKQFSGRMQIQVAPFPAERFAVSFHEEPRMEFEADILVGEKAGAMKAMIIPKIKELVLDRIKLALIERFVAPQRKYFRIPTTPKSDPVATKDPSIHIKLASSSEVPPPSPQKPTSAGSAARTRGDGASGAEIDESTLRRTAAELLAKAAEVDSSLFSSSDTVSTSSSSSINSSSPISFGPLDPSASPASKRPVSMPLSVSSSAVGDASDRVPLSTSPTASTAPSDTKLRTKIRSKYDRFKKYMFGDESSSDGAVSPPLSSSPLHAVPPTVIVSNSDTMSSASSSSSSFASQPQSPKPSPSDAMK